MTSVADMVGCTTADRGGRAARFLRCIAVVAALALAMIAAAALAERASAHGTGYVGEHSHGQLYCGNYGRINLYGDGGFYRLKAAAHGGFGQWDIILHRAHLYQWNSQGQYWAHRNSTGWYDTTVSWYANSLGFPEPRDSPFVVYPGTYKVSTEIRWYDGGFDSGSGYLGTYLGSSPNAWAQGTCTYR